MCQHLKVNNFDNLEPQPGYIYILHCIMFHTWPYLPYLIIILMSIFNVYILLYSMSIFDYHIDHQPFGGTPNVNPEKGYSLSFRGVRFVMTQHFRRQQMSNFSVDASLGCWKHLHNHNTSKEPTKRRNRETFQQKTGNLKKIYQTLIFSYLVDTVYNNNIQ